LFALIASREDASQDFVSVLAGTMPVEAFFDPRNLERYGAVPRTSSRERLSPETLARVMDVGERVPLLGARDRDPDGTGRDPHRRHRRRQPAPAVLSARPGAPSVIVGASAWVVDPGLEPTPRRSVWLVW
jgi:hypothetical protein